jgi:TetR/AcrR family transcriptional regulator, transcriptional repressor for nem operon
MRYPAGHKQETRDRIVRAAARRFRRRGTEGAGIGDLMRDLHLTHGGFYRHFDSKEDLVADAFEQGLEEIGRRLSASAERAPQGGELKALIDTYLDLEHCDDVAGGCPLAALASEVARRPRVARTRFLRMLLGHVTRMSKYVPGASEQERTRKTILLLSGMAGTLAVARAATDEAGRRAILDAAKRFYLDAARQ